MQHYAEWTTSSQFGRLSYVKPDLLTVTDEEGTLWTVEENNRGLDGDLVYIEPILDGMVQVVGVKERQGGRLVGVLQITSTKMLGTTHRGVPIYDMVPLSWRYPNFHVASKVKHTWKGDGPIRNVYAVFEFAEWTAYQKYPCGRCINVLGQITDPDAEELALLHKNSLCVKRHPQLEFADLHMKDTGLDDGRVVFSVECGITAIDPYGSVDLDDAVHVDDHHVYVHIADVDSMFGKGGTADKELSKRMTSIYGKKKTYHMLPSGFGDKVLSLNTDDWKNVVTIVMNHDLTGHSWSLSRIRVARCLTYETAQDMLSAEDPMLMKLSEIVGATDTHEIVEKLMVAANAYVGMLTSKTRALLRVMDGLPEDIGINEKVLNYVRFRNVNGAKYVPYDGSTRVGEDVSHQTLGVSHYVHFTSPIRRYADLVTHRLLKDPDSYSMTELTDLADRLNIYGQQVKRYYRDADVMELYHRLLKVAPCTTSGYLVDYNSETGNVHIFLTDYNVEYRYPLFSRKLEHIMSAELIDGTMVVRNKQSGEEWSVPLYAELDVCLSTNWTENRLNKKVIMHIDGFAETFGY